MDRMEQAEKLWDQASSGTLESDAQDLFQFNKNLTAVIRTLFGLEKAFGKNELQVKNRLQFHIRIMQACADDLSLKNKNTENFVKTKLDILTNKLRGIQQAVTQGSKSITQKSAFTRVLEDGDDTTANFQSLYQELKRRMLEAKRRETTTVMPDTILGLQEIAVLDVDPDFIRAMPPDDAVGLVKNEIKRLRGLVKSAGSSDSTEKLTHILGVYTLLRRELSENLSAETAFSEIRHTSAKMLTDSEASGIIEAPVLVTQHKFDRRAFGLLEEEDYEISIVMRHYVFIRNARLLGVRKDIVKSYNDDPAEACNQMLTDIEVNPLELVRIGNPILSSHWYCLVFPTSVKSLVRIYKWGLATDKLR